MWTGAERGRGRECEAEAGACGRGWRRGGHGRGWVQVVVVVVSQLQLKMGGRCTEMARAWPSIAMTTGGPCPPRSRSFGENSFATRPQRRHHSDGPQLDTPRAAMATALPYRDINLHSSPSHYAFSSPSSPAAPTLVVDRPSGDLRLHDGKLLGSKRVSSIAGILGIIKLRLGTPPPLTLHLLLLLQPPRRAADAPQTSTSSSSPRPSAWAG